MASYVESRRRWFGLLFLLAAVGMLIAGQTWLGARLEGVGFLLYWLTCLGLTLLALLTALLDARATRREIRAEHQEVIRRTLGGEGGERSRGGGGERRSSA